jgi:predicted methyltransferase
MRLLVIIICISYNALFGQEQWKDVYKESAWEERDQWQRADDLIRFLNLKPGNRVADIGCHEGYWSFKLSQIVGESGRVYAVDVKQDKLDKLNTIAEDRGVKNITTIIGDYDDPKLSTGTLDGAIIIDAYHEMDDHDEILQHIKSALKTNGRLLICEAIAFSRRGLSRNEQERKHEIEMKFVLEDLKKAGFKMVRQTDSFVDRSVKGDKMWVLVAVKI